jgi:hypothetical protein
MYFTGICLSINVKTRQPRMLSGAMDFECLVELGVLDV